MQEAPSDIPREGWFKSSYSGAGHTECVEVAHATQRTFVRDSKDPDGPTLAVSHDGWMAFVADARRRSPR
ncbi:DUF397 domain-containing protein [Streptomyces hiroshimensis]|uniref:DUF397 domain-containing protein n=1 Tax=Streptomyces hiroshimensis TaxID=66424 RepID=A0ABQ2Z8F0_9ACTN|nr:DUF397 domain-containing protein [Streptomyces hiroshimensis]GGY04483.1 hypothetical protein GCM10010324_58970 [Streptomyces hiroshimensis]